MAKNGCTIIAEHLGQDYDDIRDNEYQRGKFSKRVYTFGDDYWAGGIRRPKDLEGVIPDDEWVKVISNYDGTSVLWRYTP